MRVHPAADVVVEFLDDEAVVYSPSQGTLHRLDASATRYWVRMVRGEVSEPGSADDDDDYGDLLRELERAGVVVADDADDSR